MNAFTGRQPPPSLCEGDPTSGPKNRGLVARRSERGIRMNRFWSMPGVLTPILGNSKKVKKDEKREFDTILQILIDYRNCTHCTTGESPAK